MIIEKTLKPRSAFIKKHLFLIALLISLGSNINSYGQCDCQENFTPDNNCNISYTLNVSPGENITVKLKNAIEVFCKIIIPNNSIGQTATYYTYPLLFTGLENKEIVLESGVRLTGVTGGFSDCSQSVFTFDGANTNTISIHGEYDECDQYSIRPTIVMEDVVFDDDLTTAYLVASDDVGEPYLNNNGDPNYVYSDGGSDPYFDSSGNPNLILPGSNNLPVQVDCDYNDYLCNRHIIAWCPYSWEARHCIALHGVQNVAIYDLQIGSSAGGDGIHITDDESFTASKNIFINNVKFSNNARAALSITNANCVKTTSSQIDHSGISAPSNLVTPKGGINITQNTNPGSISPHLGQSPRYAMHDISILKSNLNNNHPFGIGIDVPFHLDDCDSNLDLYFKGICISNSDAALAFNHSTLNQDGNIFFSNINILEFNDYAILATDNWISPLENISFKNIYIETSQSVPDVFAIAPGSTFCNNTSVNDLCLGGAIVTAGPLCNLSYTCNLSNNYNCTDFFVDDCIPGPCVFDIEVETTIDTIVECECDYLFIVDESGSVRPDEWEEMECSILNMIHEIEEACPGCSSRFALTHFSANDNQIINPFTCDILETIGTRDGGNTNVTNALYANLQWLLSGELGEIDTSRCLQIILNTDASCTGYEYLEQGTNAGGIAEWIRVLFPNATISIVHYDPNIDLSICPEVIGEVIGDDGVFVETQFDCEIGIPVDSLVPVYIDTTTIITVSIDPNCENPIITWIASNGGEIEEISVDDTQIVTNGMGTYTVVIECESGCTGDIIEVDLDVRGVGITNNEPSIAKVRLDHIIDRTRYVDGVAYTPDEYEKLILLKEEDSRPEINDLFISPNPFNEKFNIQTKEKGKLDVEIFNNMGQRIFKNSFENQSEEITINGSQWETGVYLIRIWNYSTGKFSSGKVLRIK